METLFRIWVQVVHQHTTVGYSSCVWHRARCARGNGPSGKPVKSAQSHFFYAQGDKCPSHAAHFAAGLKWIGTVEVKNGWVVELLSTAYLSQLEPAPLMDTWIPTTAECSRTWAAVINE